MSEIVQEYNAFIIQIAVNENRLYALDDKGNIYEKIISSSIDWKNIKKPRVKERIPYKVESPND